MPAQFPTVFSTTRSAVMVRNATLRELLTDRLAGENLGPVREVKVPSDLDDLERLEVLVLDLDQQAGGSLSLCRQLRNRHPRAVIVTLSSSALPEDRVAALEAGADQLLPKPIAIDELLADIRRGLRRVVELGEPGYPISSPQSPKGSTP